MDSLKSALEKVSDEKRQHFLHFSFVRLVNSRMTIDDALKNGSLAMAKVGNQARQRLELGFEFIRNQLSLENQEKLFDHYDFFDLFKVGHSLIELTKKRIHKEVATTSFEQDDFSYFLGMYWNSFLENSEDEIAKYKFDGSSKPLEINNLDSFNLWN
jgi:hypothetical protein